MLDGKYCRKFKALSLRDTISPEGRDQNSEHGPTGVSPADRRRMFRP